MNEENNYEYRPCIYRGDGCVDAPNEGVEPDFWGVYEHVWVKTYNHRGWMLVAEFTTEADAKAYCEWKNGVVRFQTEHFHGELRADRGWFEHEELGDECGGELLFAQRELVDYDGVFELPKEIVTMLRDRGYVVEV